jgi:hypothetical protein
MSCENDENSWKKSCGNGKIEREMKPAGIRREIKIFVTRLLWRRI